MYQYIYIYISVCIEISHIRPPAGSPTLWHYSLNSYMFIHPPPGKMPNASMPQSVDPLRFCKGHFLRRKRVPSSMPKMSPNKERARNWKHFTPPKKNSFRKKVVNGSVFFNKDSSQQFLSTSRCSSVIFFLHPTCTTDHIWKVLGSDMLGSPVDLWVKSKLSECRFSWIRNGMWINSWYRKVIIGRLQIRISFAGVRCAYLKSPPLPDCLHLRETNYLTKTKILTNGSIWLSEKSVKASTG